MVMVGTVPTAVGFLSGTFWWLPLARGGGVVYDYGFLSDDGQTITMIAPSGVVVVDIDS